MCLLVANRLSTKARYARADKLVKKGLRLFMPVLRAAVLGI